MKISLNCIADYVSLPNDLSIDDIAHAITMQTVEVEGYDDLSSELEKIVLGRIETVEDQAESKNRLVKLDVGAHGTVQTMCGGSNLDVGAIVAVALPGAKIRPYGSGDYLTVASVERNGVRSDAVICGAEEIGLNTLFPVEDEKAILALPDGMGAPGDALADVLGFDDIILDVDNKSLTNRPDLWGHYGIARELAARYNLELKPEPTIPDGLETGALVGSVDPEICSRFSALDIKATNGIETPFWIKSRLARLGHKSINLYSDLTNYVMLMAGQPCHAYDAEKVKAPFSVRYGEGDERLTLINGSDVPVKGVPVIADAEKVLGAAGVMGGRQSAISEATGRVFWETAAFGAQIVRNSVAKLDLKDGTEASKRYEKALDTQRVEHAIALAVSLVKEIDGNAEIAVLSDVSNAETETLNIDVDVKLVRKQLGIDLSTEEISGILDRFGFKVTDKGEKLNVVVPSWRATGDVSGQHDIVEEIARGYGYDRFEATPVNVEILPQSFVKNSRLERKLGEYFAFRGGLQQIVTYPWAHKQFCDAGSGDWDGQILLADPPSPERSLLRTSLLPNMIEAIIKNARHSESFNLFEMGAVYLRDDASQPPQTAERLSIALYGRDPSTLLYRLFGLVKGSLEYSHINPISWAPAEHEISWLDRQAALTLFSEGKPIGSMGLLANKAKRIAGVKFGDAALLELDLSALTIMPSRTNEYNAMLSSLEKPLDLSLMFDEAVQWSTIENVAKAADPLISAVGFVDEFRGKFVPEGQKSITLRIELNVEQGKLTKQESNALAGRVSEALKQQLNAAERS